MNISNSTFPNEGLNSSLREEIPRRRDYDFTDIIALIENGYKKAPVSILQNFWSKVNDLCQKFRLTYLYPIKGMYLLFVTNFIFFMYIWRFRYARFVFDKLSI